MGNPGMGILLHGLALGLRIANRRTQPKTVLNGPVSKPASKSAKMG
jgi:hypothetical protein